MDSTITIELELYQRKKQIGMEIKKILESWEMKQN